MTNETFRILPRAIAAFAITAAFGSASFAGDFTVREGERYRATLALDSVERLADNGLIARRFRALGFSKVRVFRYRSEASGRRRLAPQGCYRALVRSLRLLDGDNGCSPPKQYLIPAMSMPHYHTS
jgi:hypothetical protein